MRLLIFTAQANRSAARYCAIFCRYFPSIRSPMFHANCYQFNANNCNAHRTTGLLSAPPRSHFTYVQMRRKAEKSTINNFENYFQQTATESHKFNFSRSLFVRVLYFPRFRSLFIFLFTVHIHVHINNVVCLCFMSFIASAHINSLYTAVAR